MKRLMSAIGPKQTWASALHMSAFGGKADILQTYRHVCISAKADICPVCDSPSGTAAWSAITARIQLARFTLFACLGSVKRTASGHPNAITAKNNDNETGKLAKG